MPAFDYKALRNGKVERGVLEADTQKQARSKLRDMKLVPLEVSQVSGSASKTKDSPKTVRSFFSKSLSVAELALVTRQIATLVEASLPVEEALRAVAKQSEKKTTASLLMAVRSKVVEGYSLAESMAEFPKVFDELYRAMVASGEKSGHLDLVLNRLAIYTEKRQHLKSKLTQAMIYPTMLTLVAIIVISILLVAVVPQVVDQFQHMGQDLPAITKILIAGSDLIRNYGIFIIIVIVCLIFLFRFLLTKPKLELKYNQMVLKMPVISRVSKSLNTARFARTLSILTASSVPLLEAMEIAAQVLTNTEAKKLVGQATARVREGTSLSSALTETKLFPPMMLYMLSSGEKSGQVEQMLERAANNQDNEFEANINLALGVFEPLIVVFMAVAVLFIVMAILQPILQLNNMVG